MLGHLYRYPHPFDATKFIYSGQGAKRHVDHYSGRSSFGRRFKKQFPGVELPQPIRETVEVENQLELNELETIWMFQHHTWHGYEGGMNLTFPGSGDYKNIGKIAGHLNRESGQIQALGRTQGRKNRESGRTQGRKNVESGQLASICSLGGRAQGRIQGRKNRESGHISALGRTQGRKNRESGHLIKARCIRWNIRRGKPCVCGKHQAA